MKAGVSFGMPAFIPTTRAMYMSSARGVDDVAEHDVLDLLRLDARALDGGACGDRAELGRRDVLERLAVGADGGARGGGDDDVGHGDGSSACSCAGEVRRSGRPGRMTRRCSTGGPARHAANGAEPLGTFRSASRARSTWRPRPRSSRTSSAARASPTSGDGAHEVRNAATGEVIAEMGRAPAQSDVDAGGRGRDEGVRRSGGRRRRPSAASRCCGSPTRSRSAARSSRELESENTGKPLALTISEEIPPGVDQIRFFAGAARMLEGTRERRVHGGPHLVIRREPIGVCGQITPWNYPFMMAIWKFAPALAAGNTVVLKPSENTPLRRCWLAELAEAPARRRVQRRRRQGRRRRAARPRTTSVDMVSITGSVRAGKAVAAAAADIAQARAPRARRQGAGDRLRRRRRRAAAMETIAGRRLLQRRPGLHRGDARARRRRRPRRLRRGAGRAGQGHRLRRPAATTTRPRARSSAPPARARRGLHRAHAGPRRGRRRRRARPTGAGYLFEPTVVDGLKQDDEMIQNEIFGPVITVQQFSDEAQALAWANGRRTGSPRRSGRRTSAARCAWPRACDFGCVWINAHIPIVAEMPHGGFKQSGYGKDLSHVRLRGLHAHQARDGEPERNRQRSASQRPAIRRGAHRSTGTSAGAGVAGRIASWKRRTSELRPAGRRLAAGRRCCGCAPTSSSWRSSGPATRRPSRVIHDRYRQRLFAYVRQMLGGLARRRRGRAAGRLHARLRRAARRRPADGRCAPGSTASRTTAASTSCAGPRRCPPSIWTLPPAPLHDPLIEAERREDLRRLVTDLGRLPEQQRSALLMRELEGLSYAELAAALGCTLRPSSRCSFARASASPRPRRRATPHASTSARTSPRPTTAACARAHCARRHLRDCADCRAYRAALRGSSRELDALTPSPGPLAWLAKLLGARRLGRSGQRAGRGHGGRRRSRTAGGGGAAGWAAASRRDRRGGRRRRGRRDRDQGRGRRVLRGRRRGRRRRKIEHRATQAAKPAASAAARRTRQCPPRARRATSRA